MSTIERMTVTLTAEMADAVRQAVEAGEYASGSEIVREALRDWKHKRALREQELTELRARVQEGLSDIEAGRVHFHRDYALYYRFTEREVIIVRVVHGARDARALMFDEDQLRPLARIHADNLVPPILSNFQRA